VPRDRPCYTFSMETDRPEKLLACYVPGCPHPRAYPREGAPILCQEHWQEFAAFQPEALRQGVGVEGYRYEAREPWLRALSYEDWRMQVFMQEKEFETMAKLEP
jgi:hypothetical protein